MVLDQVQSAGRNEKEFSPGISTEAFDKHGIRLVVDYDLSALIIVDYG